MSSRFSHEVQQALLQAGWTEGRSADDQVARWASEITEFQFLPPAVEALREFGGLVVQASGAGVDHARSNISFDPSALTGESDRFERFSKLGPFSPIGEAADGHALVVMNASGAVFAIGVDGVFRGLGATLSEALDRLVMGRRWLDTPDESCA